MNGLKQLSVTEIFKRENFSNVIFPDIKIFVELAAEYLKMPRKPKMAMMRVSDYAFKNFKRLKYQGLWWKDGDIEAFKRVNYPDKNGGYPVQIIVIARGIEAVTRLVEKDGF